MIKVTDIVLDEIKEGIGCHAPERGGALYGPKHIPVVTHFVLDTQAATTSASYTPSIWLINQISKTEEAAGLIFKGVIHSHPTGFVVPSKQDREAVRKFFEVNKHHGSILLPIVQTNAANVDILCEGFIHWYRVERRSHRGSSANFFGWGMAYREEVQVLRCESNVIFIKRDFEELIDRLSAEGFQFSLNGGLQYVKISGSTLISLSAASVCGKEIYFMVSHDYPIASPIVMYSISGEMKVLGLRWDPISTDGVKLSINDMASQLISEYS